MSRVAKKPIEMPKGVELKIDGQQVSVKGGKGQLEARLPAGIEFAIDGQIVTVAADSVARDPAMSGTARALVANMVEGVSAGFERKLELVGVGYRAQAQGKNVNLTLGFSHPVVHVLPDGVTAETPSQTEIILRGINKQAVGQVAAEIRAYRPPEPYKGKGVKYAEEVVRRKEAKKK